MKRKKNEQPDANGVEATKGAIKQVLELMSEQFQQLADDLRAFNEKHKEVQERIHRGARRTDGRIV